MNTRVKSNKRLFCIDMNSKLSNLNLDIFKWSHFYIYFSFLGDYNLVLRFAPVSLDFFPFLSNPKITFHLFISFKIYFNQTCCKYYINSKFSKE